MSVSHWHLHVVGVTSTKDSFWGKIFVLKSMIFGSSPLSNQTLKERVERYKKELAS